MTYKLPEPHYKEWGAYTVLEAQEIADAAYAAGLAENKARRDAAYLERNQCVALLAKMAMALGYPCGIAKTAIEGWSEDWHGCVFIKLPTGQVSWHFHDTHSHLFDSLPAYIGTWDGHDTSEKYRRVDAFSAGFAEGHQMTEVWSVSSKVFSVLFATEAQADRFIATTTASMGATKNRLYIAQPKPEPNHG